MTPPPFVVVVVVVAAVAAAAELDAAHSSGGGVGGVSENEQFELLHIYADCFHDENCPGCRSSQTVSPTY
jgi:hypothetical protein